MDSGTSTTGAPTPVVPSRRRALCRQAAAIAQSQGFALAPSELMDKVNRAKRQPRKQKRSKG